VKLRLLALPAVLSVLALAGSGAHAAAPLPPKPQIVDAAGDAVGSQAAYDVTGVTFEVTKKAQTSYKIVRGKKVAVTTYVPKDFQVTMTLAGAAAVQPGVSYQIGAETPCGHMFIFAYVSVFSAPDADSSVQTDECGPADPTGNTSILIDHEFTTSGNKLIWKLPFKGLPAEIKLGSVFGTPIAYTAATEPVVGYSTADFVEQTAIDYATGTDFKLS
jgi:hypothetical protein